MVKKVNYVSTWAKMKRALLILLILSCVLCECWFWSRYRRRKQEQMAERMRSQISESVAQYMQLSGSADETVEMDEPPV